MLLAQELRIGNWIERKDLGNQTERHETILELGKKAVTSGPIKVICDYDDLSGIPLTPEWLERSGFDKTGEFWNRIGEEFAGNLYEDHFALVWYELAPCQYVHQLQNLYFSLTGTELEIK